MIWFCCDDTWMQRAVILDFKILLREPRSWVIHTLAWYHGINSHIFILFVYTTAASRKKESGYKDRRFGGRNWRFKGTTYKSEAQGWTWGNASMELIPKKNQAIHFLSSSWKLWMMRKQKIIFNCWQLDSKEQGKGTFLSGDRFISSRKLHGETIVPSFLPAVGRNKRCWRKKDSPSGKKDGWFATSARRRSGSSWRTGNEVFKWNLLFNLMIVPL